MKKFNEIYPNVNKVLDHAFDLIGNYRD